LSQVIGAGRGVEDAVKAVGLLGGQVELHLRGSLYEPYHSLINALAVRCAADGRVFYYPQIDHDDLIRSMDAYDVGLALERPENVNYAKTVTNKIFSYALAGLAVAATDTPGQREVLDRMPGVGFVYPAGNVKALASGLQSFLNDRNALRSAKQAAWDLARERFCWDREQERFLQVLAGPDRERQELLQTV
jgi:glycosyltransferase involved in cell wall biosynthesis